MLVKEVSKKFKKTALDFFSVVLLFTGIFQPALARSKPEYNFIGIKEVSATTRVTSK